MIKENKRKRVSSKLKNDLLMESGWRCAVPTCRQSSPLEMAHIKDVAKGGKNEFHNMIVLCRNCHGRFDNNNERKMTRKALINIKKNLMIVNGRYSHYEMRLMEHFSLNPKEEFVELWHKSIDVMYLVRDGLIIKDGLKLQNSINSPPERYRLTETGKKLIDAWKTAQLLDDI